MGILKRRQSTENGGGLSNYHNRRCASMRKCSGDSKAILSPLLEGPSPENFVGNSYYRSRGKCGGGENDNGVDGGGWGWSSWWRSAKRRQAHQSPLGKSNSMSRIISSSSCSAADSYAVSVAAYDVVRHKHHHRFSDNDDDHHLCLLFTVFGAPLAPMSIPTHKPIPRLSHNSIPTETSSAQYIIQQYVCSTGAARISGARNMYAMGKVKMRVSEFEATAAAAAATTTARSVKNSGAAQSGCFVLWQMNPAGEKQKKKKEMWMLEMAMGGGVKAQAGSDGELVWRHTPWLGSHAAKGPVRPLRRLLQGLDPRAIAGLFSTARCIGERLVRGEECFILKAVADRRTLQSRSDADVERLGAAEILCHTIHGYFSQKTGLLLQLDDSHLSKVELGGGAAFWETTVESEIEDYRIVDGVEISHRGRSRATLLRFGGGGEGRGRAADDWGGWTTATRLQEEWAVEEVAFDVEGLSEELFIPPEEIRLDGGAAAVRGGAAATRGGGRRRCDGDIIWRVEV